MDRTRARRTRLVAAALALALTAASCAWEVEPPSIRYLPQGDARRYVDGEHHYTATLTLQKGGRGPGEVAARTTKLALDLRENVTTRNGDLTKITITVARADAEGDDAQGERDAALGRIISISPREAAWEITFSGGALGTEGQVRAADLALLAHLMAPTEPQQRPAVGESIPEAADIRTGWATTRLALSGQSVLTSEARERGRAVSLYTGTLQADAAVSVNVGTGPALSDADIVNASAVSALACLFVLVLPCLVPEVYRSLVPSPTVNMTGPMTVQQTAVLHRESGRLLRVRGTGTAQIGGTLPTINLARSRTAPAEARELSGKDVGINLAWTFDEALADRWPNDPIPRSVVIVAVALIATVVLAQLGWAFAGRRPRRGAGLALAT